MEVKKECTCEHCGYTRNCELYYTRSIRKSRKKGCYDDIVIRGIEFVCGKCKYEHDDIERFMRRDNKFYKQTDFIHSLKQAKFLKYMRYIPKRIIEGKLYESVYIDEDGKVLENEQLKKN